MIIIKILKIIAIFFYFSSNLYAKNNFYSEGLVLFEKKKLNEAKFKFEQDIVFNPKNEMSYLYLSKIFNSQNKQELEEKNLDTVILLNPKNEEAVYNLAKLKLSKSDYIESKNLINQLLLNCKNFCNKSNKLKKEIEKSLKK